METDKKHVEVVATDGDELWRVLWIKQSRDGSIYLGPAISFPEIDLHSSYHTSGAFHFSRHQEGFKFQKLSDFKGIHTIITHAIPKDIKKRPYEPFKSKKLDGLVYIDFRAMKNNTVNIHLCLIEQGRLDLLQNLLQKTSPDLQITIFTCIEPWLVIAAQSF